MKNETINNHCTATDGKPPVVGSLVKPHDRFKNAALFLCGYLSYPNERVDEVASIIRRYAGMVLARQSEVISQDAEECWNFGVKNSLFSAGLGRKSTAYPLLMGTEGTVVNSLFDADDKKEPLSDFVPRYLIIDECHQVDWADVVGGATTQYGIIINTFMKR